MNENKNIPMLDFTDYAVTTAEELREIVGTPHEAVVKKNVSVVDEQASKFIAMSPMLYIATSDAEGRCDVSPRGDKPGFVHVASEKQLLLPDRPGNRRADTMHNILANPQVGLIFLIPGMNEVLRVNGKAVVIANHPLLEQLKFKEQPAKLGIAIEVEECYIHCPRALHQAHLWEKETWPAVEALPSSKEIFLAHLKINGYELTE